MARRRQQVEWDPEDISSVALVDFDNKKLLWGEQDGFETARSYSVYNRLLNKTWPGFSIEQLSEERKAKLNELLGSCGLPSWEKLEQQFPEMSEFGL